MHDRMSRFTSSMDWAAGRERVAMRTDTPRDCHMVCSLSGRPRVHAWSRLAATRTLTSGNSDHTDLHQRENHVDDIIIKIIKKYVVTLSTILLSCVSFFLTLLDKEATNRCFVTRGTRGPTLVSRHVSARNSVVAIYYYYTRRCMCREMK